MADDKSLELKSVIAKFNQSSSALDSLTERLSALSNASVEIARAEKGITESSQQIKRVADEITGVSIELRNANVAVKSAIESVAAFLNETELGAMKKGIDQIYVAIIDQLVTLTNKLDVKVQGENNLKTQISGLQAKIDVVPEKFKKKLGWSV